MTRLPTVLALTSLAGCTAPAEPPRTPSSAPSLPSASAAPGGDAPPPPIEYVAVPTPLPLPGQLKPAPGGTTEARDPRTRVAVANGAARIEPSASGWINAVQVYPFSDGTLGDRRHAVRHWPHRARPYSSKACTRGSRNEPRDQHRSTHLPCRAEVGPAHLHGVSLLDLCPGSIDRAEAAERQPRHGRPRGNRTARIARSTGIWLPHRRRSSALASGARVRRRPAGDD